MGSYGLNLGCCGLHPANGAFQTDSKTTPWDMGIIMKGRCQVFYDSPATENVCDKIFEVKRTFKQHFN